jgi:hypothetical protein
MSTGLITHSGRLVTLSEGVPSLVDVGLSLSRTPRFGGHTNRWWTVAHHVLWLHDYARRLGESVDVQNAVLIHDAHESLFGDISTHFKTAETRAHQHVVDQRFADHYMAAGWSTYLAVKPEVDWLDHNALQAEAVAVGPPILQEDPKLLDEHFYGRPSANAVAFLVHWIDAKYSDLMDPAQLAHNERAPLVRAYIDRVLGYLS